MKLDKNSEKNRQNGLRIKHANIFFTLNIIVMWPRLQDSAELEHPDLKKKEFYQDRFK